MARSRTGAWDRSRLALALALALATLSGCGGRSYREIHATTHYNHHATGTELETHARYR